ncbi:uncharacterized protein SPPG_01586 [Spizellomyces punctatus DAOM BR117]|uniref:C3H1-type domain-containing protein n=1 Tax=Spizellomyces punctatus (strain DAOM BR117) TaxID=645134 RepID=A0A0L0HS16_SPIPD|nr:uncharacterized protein SPPG_01586 [Spizellomyces punctatus DAOM BR117]KND04151.1 hypothetical protein SPPG_01586 [Spizellomyces punctatus DAOM BR117]|eukprot:XP_016612190.1 hypothetical protein SPPG_01586 [Spizellomyces punctatus DAOM BR117]
MSLECNTSLDMPDPTSEEINEDVGNYQSTAADMGTISVDPMYQNSARAAEEDVKRLEYEKETQGRNIICDSDNEELDKTIGDSLNLRGQHLDSDSSTVNLAQNSKKDEQQIQLEVPVGQTGPDQSEYINSPVPNATTPHKDPSPELILVSAPFLKCPPFFEEPTKTNLTFDLQDTESKTEKEERLSVSGDVSSDVAVARIELLHGPVYETTKSTLVACSPDVTCSKEPVLETEKGESIKDRVQNSVEESRAGGLPPNGVTDTKTLCGVTDEAQEERNNSVDHETVNITADSTLEAEEQNESSGNMDIMGRTQLATTIDESSEQRQDHLNLVDPKSESENNARELNVSPTDDISANNAAAEDQLSETTSKLIDTVEPDDKVPECPPTEPLILADYPKMSLEERVLCETAHAAADEVKRPRERHQPDTSVFHSCVVEQIDGHLSDYTANSPHPTDQKETDGRDIPVTDSTSTPQEADREDIEASEEQWRKLGVTLLSSNASKNVAKGKKPADVSDDFVQGSPESESRPKTWMDYNYRILSLNGGYNNTAPFCKYFNNGKGCFAGDKCRFPHVSPAEERRLLNLYLYNHQQPSKNVRGGNKRSQIKHKAGSDRNEDGKHLAKHALHESKEISESSSGRRPKRHWSHWDDKL